MAAGNGTVNFRYFNSFAKLAEVQEEIGVILILFY